ncbi:transcription factor tau subunit sfc4 [Rhypophila decipiens]|uniref:Transcription factor tau subunit sfc4 n=1 Tax=Rhypophila decipiens TaxID=261697 RepID=A0AAN6Y1Y8_9PEZI|nr:transcription factor tau subunit sfc4 [Rhypophila decipiens]
MEDHNDKMDLDHPPPPPPPRSDHHHHQEEEEEEEIGIDIYGNDDDDNLTDELSDADSDELELRANNARFDALQEAFVAQQRAEAASYREAVDKGGRVSPHPAEPSSSGTPTSSKPKAPPKRRLGPRKAARPTPDIQFRLSVARRAFEEKDYHSAVAMLSEIIRINSETYQAWTLLSTVHEELGDREKATMCLMTAAHLVPKNVPSWINAAAYALHGVEDMEDDSPERAQALERAIDCYSKALTADKRNIEARTGKADVLMMQGHSALALAQYAKALEFRPYNIRTVRNMADVALDVKDPRRTAEGAKKAYRRVIDRLMERGTFEAEEGMFEWSDLRIYLEFFGILERWGEAARELKEISRWLLGRREEGHVWDGAAMGEEDDAEWDVNDDRRIEVHGYQPGRFPVESYGMGLPVDLRAKLYYYRYKMGMEREAELHLSLLDPTGDTAVDDFMDFPDCLKDIGNSLLEGERHDRAMQYFNLFREIANVTGDVVVDADILVSQGRCHLALGDKSAAEECFIAAIETEEDHIEARVQLANMYEGEQEQEGREEAFLLVREALNLEARQGADGKMRKPRKSRGPYGPRKPKDDKDGPPRPPGAKKSTYIPRRLINAEKRKQQDLKMTEVASKNYATLMELRDKVVAVADKQTRSEADKQAEAAWMAAARDLVDDFRSYKEFYPWEKYIKYLGYGGNVQGQASLPARSFKLAAMAQRLQQTLAPAEGQEGAAAAAPAINKPEAPKAHRGIPFDKWLDIFLDYAFYLVRAGQHKEAYVVCHAARDSTIWTAIDTTYLIHLAWASCAIYAGDEETCVAIARYFMRDYRPGTDSYRMFSAMCRVCQTPVSWYTSGPAQKFILRQIKTMDTIITKRLKEKASDDDNMTNQELDLGDLNAASIAANSEDGIGLDVCLLTIYGHILFSTTSYVYALNYLARSASIDPNNPLINMSIGLAYLHYALKRQATNRQYLLMQGFSFLFRYYKDRLAPKKVVVTKTIKEGDNMLERTVERQVRPRKAQRQETHFNIARAYGLIGLGNLANEYYLKVLKEEDDEEDDQEEEEGVNVVGSEDLTIEAAYNVRTMCFLLGDIQGAKVVADRWLSL